MHSCGFTRNPSKSNEIQRNPSLGVQIEIRPSNWLVLDFVGFRWLRAAQFWISLDFADFPLAREVAVESYQDSVRRRGAIVEADAE